MQTIIKQLRFTTKYTKNVSNALTVLCSFHGITQNNKHLLKYETKTIELGFWSRYR